MLRTAPPSTSERVADDTALTASFSTPQIVKGPTGLYFASNVADMRARLIQLKAPVYGDKATLWKRLVVYEQRAQEEKELVSAAQAEVQRRREGQGDVPITYMPVPVQPTQEGSQSMI